VLALNLSEHLFAYNQNAYLSMTNGLVLYDKLYFNIPIFQALTDDYAVSKLWV